MGHEEFVEVYIHLDAYSLHSNAAIAALGFQPFMMNNPLMTTGEYYRLDAAYITLASLSARIREHAA